MSAYDDDWGRADNSPEFSRANPDKARAIAAWLTRLAHLVRRNGSDGSKEQIALYTELLGPEIETAAFNTRALRYVADGCEWWPSYSEMLGRLREHWASEKFRREQAKVLQIAGPAPVGELTGTDAAWAALYHRRQAHGWANGTEILTDEVERQARRSRCLSMMKRYAPGAYHAATGQLANPPADPSGWSDLQALRQTLLGVVECGLNTVVGRSLAAAAWVAVENKAPQNAWLCTEILGPKKGAKTEVKRGAA